MFGGGYGCSWGGDVLVCSLIAGGWVVLRVVGACMWSSSPRGRWLPMLETSRRTC